MLTTDFPAGAPCWIDLGSPDIPATADFYKQVFGWTYTSAGPDTGGYGFFQLNGKTVGAIGPLNEGDQSTWTTYFLTADADATTKAVEQAGGSVRVAPMDVMSEGRFAQLTDPQGADFAIWQAGSTTGLDAVSADNALVWAELHTPDQDAGLEFYRKVFGWRAETFRPDPNLLYQVISPADGDQQATSFGGIAPVMQGQPPAWTPYFATEDVDALIAKATAAGGSVLMPAADVENVGRIAWLADPNGAPFALLKPEPQES
ncbi:VOC family protein [Streptomyces kaniharaensis]|uniref:VOC family protein n=1 Tax=Streptomyces kaniharaensis TaxID=212423 RepID=A0A6N7KKA1_9ACTN|nr:VOC family protein [Streptomyces kaniharaensis]MQS11801.1 VOC family protein [Streptomyces kaniharaensis]